MSALGAPFELRVPNRADEEEEEESEDNGASHNDNHCKEECVRTLPLLSLLSLSLSLSLSPLFLSPISVQSYIQAIQNHTPTLLQGLYLLGL